MEGFFVSHHWCTLVYFYFKFTTHPVYNNFQMQLTHTTQNGLAGFFICTYPQRRIFLYQFGNGHTHSINVGLCFWFYRYRNYRLREGHTFQYNRKIFITEGITGFNILKSNSCTNIASLNKVYRILLVGMHLHNTTDTLIFTCTGV